MSREIEIEKLRLLLVGVGDISKDLRKEATIAIDKGYRKQEWISVEERLPENDHGKHWKERQRYLVFTEPNGLMYVAKYGYKEYGWWTDNGGYVLDEKNYRKVTHWMPLPEAPKPRKAVKRNESRDR